ncbi:MAG: hypothetical protein ABSF95_22855 [Verrucomicrobiota bacterium]|jgi:hypothetical protein
MNYGIPRLRHGSITLPTWFLALVAAGTFTPGAGLQAQSDNFNSGSAPAWVHYDVGDIVPGLGATYTFPADGTGGYAYRIHSPPDAPYDGPPYNVGPSRALAWRPDVTYGGRFSVGVDVINWDNTIDQAFGPVWFIQNPGPGTTGGYVMSWEPVGREILISVVNGESPTTVGRLQNVILDPTQRYRFVASSHDGSTYLAQVFHPSDLDNPVAAAIASDGTYNGGWMGMLVYDGTSPSTVGADATFDNYSASTPAANSLRTTVAHVSPAANEKFTGLYPTIAVAILDRDTTVDTGAILLWLDGNLLPSADVNIVAAVTEAGNPGGYPNVFGGATVTYAITSLLPWNSTHTNSIAFRDNTGFWKTNTWAWTSYYPYLDASNSLPLGSFTLRGWDARMVWTNGPALGNSLARAEQQLAVPPQIPWLLSTQTVVQVLNWNDAGDGVNAQTFGYFNDPTLVSGVPGLAPDGSHDNIACESFAYLELSAGVHRFGAVSDDGFQLRSGAGLHDTQAMVLGVHDGGTFNGTFDFVVESTGLYPARCLWYENGGSADFQLFSVDLNDPTARTLVNDPSDPAGSVKAYLPIRLVSSANVQGPYTTMAGAVIDTVNQTVTAPRSGPAQFYRLQTLNPVTLTGITVLGNNVAITYR